HDGVPAVHGVEYGHRVRRIPQDEVLAHFGAHETSVAECAPELPAVADDFRVGINAPGAGPQAGVTRSRAGGIAVHDHAHGAVTIAGSFRAGDVHDPVVRIRTRDHGGFHACVQPAPLMIMALHQPLGIRGPFDHVV